MIAGGFLILYVAAFNKRKKKHKEETERLRKAFEEELIKTQLEVQEQTLQNIASEIHDNVGQLLSLTRLTLGSANIPEDPLDAQEKVTASLEFLTSSIRELRQLSALLHAENILAAGLETALQKELNWLGRSGKYEICFHRSGDNDSPVDPRAEIIAFRLIQELLNNIIKHANATRLEVIFNYHPQGVLISISDNGIGFDINEKLKSPTGLGINNLFRRAHVIGGELTLQSTSGKGTLARLKIPAGC